MEGGGGGEGARPGASASILSAAVARAVAASDAPLALDMLLVHEALLAADAARAASEQEARALKEALAEAAQQQSAMHAYLHGQLDAQTARAAALERALAAARAESEAESEAARSALESLEAAHAEALSKAEGEAEALADKLRKVHAFVEQQQALEEELAAAKQQLAASAEGEKERAAERERAFLEAAERGKRELLARVQATKEALERRTAGQLPTATKRTMMENELFLEELAFQSRESEALAARCERLDAERRALKAQAEMLEANEGALARKALYYRRMLRALQAGGERRLRARVCAVDEGSQDNEEEDEEDEDEEDAGETREDARGQQEDARVDVLEKRLARALEWVRVLETDKQLLLARQDEVLQFLMGALDEGAREMRPHSDKDKEQEQEQEKQLAAAARETHSVRELVALFPRPLAPALDDLDTRALLRFLVEKLRVYQQQVAVVFHQSLTSSTSSPIKSPSKLVDKYSVDRVADKSVDKLVDRSKGLELPPITGAGACSPAKTKAAAKMPNATTSPRQRRALFAHVSSAVARQEAAAPRAANADLMAMATNQFNFICPPTITRKAPVVAKSAPSPARGSPVRRPPASTAVLQALDKAADTSVAPSASTAELLTPWTTEKAEREEEQ